MKKILKLTAFFGLFLLAFSGCENPDTTEELPYYYTEPIAYLKSVDTHVTINHSPDGIVNADVAMPVTVGLSQTITGSCTVRVECTVEGEGLTLQHVNLPDNGIVTIPAGERSATFSMSIRDWSFCSEISEARSYTLSLKIVEATTRISTNLNSVVYVLDKSRRSYTSTQAPTEGTQVAPDTYTVSYNLDPEKEVWTPTVLDSNGLFSKYLYTYDYLGLQFDLGETRNVTAVANYCYPYSPTYNNGVYTIKTSVDGEQWTTYDEEQTLGQTDPQYVSFYTPVSARYVRLLMFGTTAFSNGALIYVK